MDWGLLSDAITVVLMTQVLILYARGYRIQLRPPIRNEEAK